MILEFHPAARDEFVAAAEYYETERSWPRGRFLVAVTHATDTILQPPDVDGRRGAHARQLIVSGFPYDVVYTCRNDTVSILAVEHHHRRPGYWRDRLNG